MLSATCCVSALTEFPAVFLLDRAGFSSNIATRNGNERDGKGRSAMQTRRFFYALLFITLRQELPRSTKTSQTQEYFDERRAISYYTMIAARMLQRSAVIDAPSRCAAEKP